MRHIGRRMRPACRAAATSAAISGVGSTWHSVPTTLPAPAAAVYGRARVFVLLN